MKKQTGFTLIEVMIFIVVTSLLASGILLAYVGALGNSPSIMQNVIANQTAMQCAEWYLGQRRLKGYNSISCTSTLSTPSNCVVPTGYTLSGSCSQTTLRGDSAYETLTFSVNGIGRASLTLLLGNY